MAGAGGGDSLIQTFWEASFFQWLKGLIAEAIQMIRGLEELWRQVFTAGPWVPLGLFLICAILMVHRLNALERKGLEGTVLGTVVMPYASGFPNLMFALSLGRQGGSGWVLVENCIVNNVTNLTLLMGLPAMIWNLSIRPAASAGKRRKRVSPEHSLNVLSLALTLSALLFFTGSLWAMGRDGTLDFGDGLVLVGTFFFWQLFQVFDVIKYNIHRRRDLKWTILADALLVVAFGIGVFAGIDQLVNWVMAQGPGVFVYDRLGLVSGCLMVLPNAFLAGYYAWIGRVDIVYSSQVGDAHICIPMCIGLFALFSQIQIPADMEKGIFIILGVGLIHLFFIGLLGRLPRIMGLVLTLTYGIFLYFGIVSSS